MTLIKYRTINCYKDLEALSRSLQAQLQCHKKMAEDHISVLDRDLQLHVERERTSDAIAFKFKKANENLSMELQDLRAAVEKVRIHGIVWRCFYLLLTVYSMLKTAKFTKRSA